jgi:hypothetical protein
MFTDLIIGLIPGFIFFGFYNTGPSIIFASLLFSILPDIDFLIYHKSHPVNRFSHKHRRILHLPLLYIPIGLSILYLFHTRTVFSISFLALSLWHFVHDTFSLGYGVQWLFPLSKKQFFWGNTTNTSKKFFGKLYSDTPDNIDVHADMHGDDNWAGKSLFR